MHDWHRAVGHGVQLQGGMRCEADGLVLVWVQAAVHSVPTRAALLQVGELAPPPAPSARPHLHPHFPPPIYPRPHTSHLVEAAGLKARGHEQDVRSGGDAVRHLDREAHP